MQCCGYVQIYANSFWPGDAIWWQICWWTLVQVNGLLPDCKCIWKCHPLKCRPFCLGHTMLIYIWCQIVIHHQQWMLWFVFNESINLTYFDLFQSAKLDPYYSDTFLYLGHYYGKLLGDSGKARRCYQKAYELRPGSDAGGCALVDALVAQDEHVSTL